MRISNGFDRISTPEELHQVMAVLGEFAQSAWPSLADNELDSTPWMDAPMDDAEAASLAELVINSPEFKN
jgi:hypothetical protein